MNTARVEVEKGGTVTTVKEEQLDPLEGLWTPGNHAHTKVGIQVGTQREMGLIHIRVYVEYECDQKEKVIDETGMRTFSKALEFMNDGLTLMSGT